jgi:crossover junction endodeoxyribonuclease RuvC
VVNIVAIDPGLDGALAYLQLVGPNTVTRLAVLDMPTIALPGKRIVDGAEVARWVRARYPNVCVVEQVASRPKQGVVSVFSFGRALGTVEGVIHACGISLERVTPQVWQRATGVLSVADPRGRALELLPRARGLLDRKKDIGRADALLMAFWWANKGGRKAEADTAAW